MIRVWRAAFKRRGVDAYTLLDPAVLLLGVLRNNSDGYSSQSCFITVKSWKPKSSNRGLIKLCMLHNGILGNT